MFVKKYLSNLITGANHKNSLTWAILVSIGIKRKQRLQTYLLELHNFYKLNVWYVTTYIIRSDYYSVTDKFKLKKKQLYGLGTNEIDLHNTTRIC